MYFAILEMNSGSQLYLRQFGVGFISNGASALSIHLPAVHVTLAANEMTCAWFAIDYTF